MTPGLDYVAVAALGALVGLTELVTRYRDEPLAGVASPPSLFYLAVNAVVALVGLGLVRVFDWTLGVGGGPGGDERVRAVQVLVAGVAAMAALRSSLLTIRLGNQDVAIGPGSVVRGLLATADAAVDRHRGWSRDRDVRAMDTVAFAKAAEALPAYCLGLMQNLSPADQAQMAERIAEIRRMRADDRVKNRLLGLAIIDAVGTRVLVRAIDSLGESIQPDHSDRV